MTACCVVSSPVFLVCACETPPCYQVKGESCLVGAGRLLALSFVAHGASHLFEKPNIGVRNGAIREQSDETFPEVFERRRSREEAFGLFAQFHQLVQQVGNL